MLLKFLIGLNLLISIFSIQRKTPVNSYGAGELIYLDRHRVYCLDGEVLAGFELFRPSKTTISFKYECLSTGKYSGQYIDHTTWTKSADNIFLMNLGANKLSNLPVQCKADFALQGFHLESVCTEPICDVRIVFSCAPIKIVKCGSDLTPWGDAVSGPNYALEKVPIKSKESTALTGFRLKVSYYFRWFAAAGQQFQWAYNSCQFIDTTLLVTPTTTDTTSNLRLLDELN